MYSRFILTWSVFGNKHLLVVQEEFMFENSVFTFTAKYYGKLYFMSVVTLLLT